MGAELYQNRALRLCEENKKKSELTNEARNSLFFNRPIFKTPATLTRFEW
jgi:hypothetical protein